MTEISGLQAKSGISSILTVFLKMGDRQYHLKFDADKGRAVDEYLEYRR